MTTTFIDDKDNAENFSFHAAAFSISKDCAVKHYTDQECSEYIQAAVFLCKKTGRHFPGYIEPCWNDGAVIDASDPYTSDYEAAHAADQMAFAAAQKHYETDESWQAGIHAASLKQEIKDFCTLMLDNPEKRKFLKDKMREVTKKYVEIINGYIYCQESFNNGLESY